MRKFIFGYILISLINFELYAAGRLTFFESVCSRASLAKRFVSSRPLVYAKKPLSQLKSKSRGYLSLHTLNESKRKSYTTISFTSLAAVAASIISGTDNGEKNFSLDNCFGDSEIYWTKENLVCTQEFPPLSDNYTQLLRRIEFLPEEHKQKLAEQLALKYLSAMSIYERFVLFSYFSEEQKARWAVDCAVLYIQQELHHQGFKKQIEEIPSDKRIEFIFNFISKKLLQQDIDPEDVMKIFSFFSNEEVYQWFNERYCHIFISLNNCSKNYIYKHIHQTGILFLWHEGKENFNALLESIYVFAEQENQKGNIVVYHGQSAEWGIIEKIFRELYQVVHGEDVPEDFIFMRYNEEDVLSDQEVKTLRGTGVAPENYQKYRNYVLFTALDPIVNYDGTSPYHYVHTNADLTIPQDASVFHSMIKKNFEYLGLAQEYDLLEKEAGLLTELYELYKDAVQDQGNLGRLLIFSMTPECAKKIAYSGTSSAELNPISLESFEQSNKRLLAQCDFSHMILPAYSSLCSVDLVVLDNEKTDIPFGTEICLLLGRCFTNPHEAKKAGLKMVAVDPVSTQETEKYKAFVDLLEKICSFIKKLRNPNKVN